MKWERYHLIVAAQNFNGYDKHVMENVKLVDARKEGVTEYEFLIGERYGNVNEVMHGGAAGVIFDMCTTTALGPVARKGYWEWVLCFLLGVECLNKVGGENRGG